MPEIAYIERAFTDAWLDVIAKANAVCAAYAATRKTVNLGIPSFKPSRSAVPQHPRADR